MQRPRLTSVATLLTVSGFFCMLFASSASASPKIGQPAPVFSAENLEKENVALEAMKGSFVVLEWFNYGCPYVRKHYRNKDMQALQEKYTAKGVQWITINSTAKDHRDYRDVEATKTLLSELKAANTHMILDTSGEIGKKYAASTTPHLYLISPEGVLLYQGAIDDNDEADSDPKEAKNYIKAALDSALAGEAVQESDTKPYGCSIKYAE